MFKICPCGTPAPKSRGLCDRCRQRKQELARRVNPCECGCGVLVSRRFEAGHQTRLFTREEQGRRGRQNTGDKQRDRGSADWYRKLHGRHEHRRVAEQMLGRVLLPGEIVHHKNGNKKDNRPENLSVMTRAQHIAEHRADLIEGARRARS